MKGSIHVCKVNEKLDRTSLIGKLNVLPCDKIISSKTHTIIGLLKTGY